MRLFLAGLLLMLASNSFAAPSLRLSWDDCSVLSTNKDWAGPGTYRLVVSGAGFSGSSQNLGVSIGFSTRRAVPAWDFSTVDYWGYGPCQSPSRMTVGSGSGTCPNYPASLVTGEMIEGSLTQPALTSIELSSTLDPSFLADPDVRYSFFRIDFDHSYSIPGPSAPPYCGEVEEPFCMMIRRSYWVPGGGMGTYDLATDGYARWQDSTNSTPCEPPVPATARTWGSLKVQYR